MSIWRFLCQIAVKKPPFSPIRGIRRFFNMYDFEQRPLLRKKRVLKNAGNIPEKGVSGADDRHLRIISFFPEKE